MGPLLLLASGFALLIVAALVLRSFGPRLRVGRLLASTPRVSVGEACALADSGGRRYVRVDGRLDSDDEFEDADHRPLVLRRTRFQAATGRRWDTFGERREQVPFTLNEGLDSIVIDATSLDDGLVVVPRESSGTALELPDAPAGMSPETRVRVRIEQLSSVEHATALGVPVRTGDGVQLTSGLGRPLVVTTLETPEAMRVLADGRTLAPRLAAALIGTGMILLLGGVLWLVVDRLA